jgi:transcriptional regulator with XRE-family HTH domain
MIFGFLLSVKKYYLWYMNLGIAIQKSRKGKYNQKEIARLTGVTNSYVSMIEHNHKEPSISWLSFFGLVVGVPVPVIFWMAITTEDIIQEDALTDYEVMKPLIDDYMKQCFGDAFVY